MTMSVPFPYDSLPNIHNNSYIPSPPPQAELETLKAANGGVLPPREPREAGLKENPEYPFKYVTSTLPS